MVFSFATFCMPKKWRKKSTTGTNRKLALNPQRPALSLAVQLAFTLPVDIPAYRQAGAHLAKAKSNFRALIFLIRSLKHSCLARPSEARVEWANGWSVRKVRLGIFY
jgi:hypothetical protein